MCPMGQYLLTIDSFLGGELLRTNGRSRQKNVLVEFGIRCIRYETVNLTAMTFGETLFEFEKKRNVFNGNEIISDPNKHKKYIQYNVWPKHHHMA